jgi:hypothetical protein
VFPSAGLYYRDNDVRHPSPPTVKLILAGTMFSGVRGKSADMNLTATASISAFFAWHLRSINPRYICLAHPYFPRLDNLSPARSFLPIRMYAEVWRQGGT